MPVTRGEAQKLRVALEAFLKEYGDKNKLDFNVGTIRFDDRTMSCKVTGNLQGVKTHDEVALQRHMNLNNFKQEAIMPGHGMVKLVAYKPRSYTYPWVIEKQNGARLKLTQAGAEKYFKV